MLLEYLRYRYIFGSETKFKHFYKILRHNFANVSDPLPSLRVKINVLCLVKPIIYSRIRALGKQEV